jgi:hypothetical protein
MVSVVIESRKRNHHNYAPICINYVCTYKDLRNKGDYEFINKHLLYYENLATIFGNNVVTGQFTRTSHEPLLQRRVTIHKRMGLNHHLVLLISMRLEHL